MKNFLSKYSVTATLLFLCASSALAQTTEKDLGGSGDWKGAIVSGHNLWKKSACLAFTKSADGGSYLEVYAEQEGENKGSYTEPTIQLVTKEAGYVRGVLSDSSGDETYQLTLASTREDKPAFGLLARFAERKKIVDFLKRASSAKVQLLNAKGKPVKALSFSLKGSTKTIDGTMSSCQLSL